MLIQVEEVQDFFIPNSITPNGDGRNDYFTVFSGERAVIDQIENLSVYSRTGLKVFQNENFQPDLEEEAWPAKGSESEYAAGLYYYSVSVRLISGKSYLYSGYIQLIR